MYKRQDLCRKNNRHIHLNIDEDIFKESLADSNLVEDFILDLEKKEEILQILNSISNINKNLLFFKYDAGLSYKEIAELLDINEKTVKPIFLELENNLKSYGGISMNMMSDEEKLKELFDMKEKPRFNKIIRRAKAVSYTHLEEEETDETN